MMKKIWRSTVLVAALMLAPAQAFAHPGGEAISPELKQIHAQIKEIKDQNHELMRKIHDKFRTQMEALKKAKESRDTAAERAAISKLREMEQQIVQLKKERLRFEQNTNEQLKKLAQ